MRSHRRLLEVGLLLLVTAALTACETPASAPVPPSPPPAPVCPEPPAPQPAEVDELKAALAYATELRTRTTPELTPIPEATNVVAVQAMRKALALSQGRSSAELQQAVAQLDIVNAATDPQAEQLKPLAGLLGARLAEQRRLQDSVDKLNQQLREAQRRNDQLNEKLEALKAIEQTLPAKPGGAPR